jgi:hypothetical protein
MSEFSTAITKKLSTYFGVPETIFFSVRYIDNIHLYLWLFKDLAWSLNYKNFGMAFGTLAILWLGVLYYYAIKSGTTEEIYFVVPTTFWLLGNYLWMMGNITYDDDDTYRPKGRACMITGIVIIMCYYIFCKIFKFINLNSNEKEDQIYNEVGLKSRFSFFKTFKQYEHFHMFCWLGKDLCWNGNVKVLWFLFVLPTFIISGDFIVLSIRNPVIIIDCAHYIAQFMWVTANISWAYQELFVDDMNDNPQNISHPHIHTSQLFCTD